MKYKYTRQQLESMQADPFMTDREKDVFNLYYVRGWHTMDIAAELDVSRGTINNTLRSIRGKTR